MPDTPYSILDSQQHQLRRYYTDREQKLRIRRLPKAQHNAELANMQSAYDAQKFRISSMRSQLDDIRRSGTDPTLRDEAMWRLVVPPEQAAAMFPTVKKPTERVPISPPSLKSHLKTMVKFAEAAPSIGEIFTREKFEPRSQTDLIKQYTAWREAMGYANYTPGQQRQLDFQWDELMRDRPKYEWNPKSPEILSLRTYGGRITGIAAKKISPLAKSIEKGKKTWGWPTLTKPAYRVRSESELRKQGTKEAYQQGIKLGYWQ